MDLALTPTSATSAPKNLSEALKSADQKRRHGARNPRTVIADLRQHTQVMQKEGRLTVTYATSLACAGEEVAMQVANESKAIMSGVAQLAAAVDRLGDVVESMHTY